MRNQEEEMKRVGLDCLKVVPDGRGRQGDGSCRPTRGRHPNQASTVADPFWLTLSVHSIYQKCF